MTRCCRTFRALARLGKQLAAESEGAALDVAVTVEGAVRPVRPNVRYEIFQAAAEALRNAFQHSRGTRIEVELSMRERVALAGGTLTVWSAPDCGTEVEFIVPASAAYAAPVVSSALDPDEAGAH